jgi:hypothetical protein
LETFAQGRLFDSIKGFQYVTPNAELRTHYFFLVFNRTLLLQQAA